MMFQMRPPFSLNTKKPASQPAIAPKSRVSKMFMVIVLVIDTKIENIIETYKRAFAQLRLIVYLYAPILIVGRYRYEEMGRFES